MRIVSLSFDDGTIYDIRFIELLNKYNIRATLNLNSGLDNFVWLYEDKTPIRRLILKDYKDLYKNHEVASHSLTHPYFSSLDKDEIIKESKEDIKNLSLIFDREIKGFAFPFYDQTEDNINVVKDNNELSYIRYSYLSDSVIHKDRYHIHINALYDDIDIYDKLNRFKNCREQDALFVIAGHSYEFEVKNDWKKIEELLIYLNKEGFVVLPLIEAVEKIFKK